MKRILKIVGIIVAVLIVIAIAIPFFIDANSFRPKIESDLSAALGREVKVGNRAASPRTTFPSLTIPPSASRHSSRPSRSRSEWN
jgi:hypothetical protein